MDTYLALSARDRRDYCAAAADRIGLDAPSIEKDFWVCWILRELFALPAIGPHLTFKGGTSLSKGWKLIQRFSEDVDVVIDRGILGFGGDHAPQTAGISKKERERRLEGLRAACQAHIRGVLLPALTAQLGKRLPPTVTWELTVDSADPDGQTLLFNYAAAFDAGPYLRPVVKIELGARSDTEPSSYPEIRPYLAEAYPEKFMHAAFAPHTLSPERTFWEKAMLLHEETYRTGSDGPKPRLARHYYDLWCLIKAGVADQARANANLFEQVAAHRAVFFRKRKEAHDSLRPGALRLLPLAGLQAAWKQDYQAMRDAMFFAEPPSFDEILRVVGEFQEKFNRPSR